MPKSNPDDVGKRVAWARHCALCDKQQTFESGSLGTLLGPVGEDAAGLPIFVHRLCALWSPEVYQTDQGTLRCVMAAVKRGRAMRCCECQQRGATIGCRLERCPLSFHLHCAALRAGAAGCTFYPDKYMVACAEHAPLFKHEAQQNRVFPQSPYRAPAVPRGASRHQQPDAPEVSEQRPHKKRRQGGVDPAVHMRLAHEALKSASIGARAYENESSDDEEHFRKKERQRIIRDRAKLNPLVLGAGGRAQAAGSVQAMAGDPTGRNDVDLEGWDAVGGHEAAVKQLKEMVLLPLLYPDLFRQMNIHPPRGILFHGPPGTGKTLVARALAGACSLHSPKPVTFFARKGADCLGKFAGEAERTLRLLFDEASRAAPSIIFLDELDGLVPARSARSGGSDQIYASVVSTLLALMDGITDRGAVVVIGATNRPEAIDPALRRPGRFDREVYFGLPTLAERNAILAVHTRKWPERPSPRTLEAVAGAAEGFAGADLQALCSAAVLAAVQRQAPRLIDQLDQQHQGEAV
ncbi:hypothetical protein WJX72_007259 [[Myrmecia] bisecta]|uniref:PHD-type domain-containing protein n=1 Tax=[Myrmecia] bisecta TaxID=41462 RepID=A0AAW1Q5I3_9CHLO